MKQNQTEKHTPLCFKKPIQKTEENNSQTRNIEVIYEQRSVDLKKSSRKQDKTSSLRNFKVLYKNQE